MDRDATAKPRLVPPSHGFAWMVQSLSLIRLQAGRLLLIGLLMQLILGLSQLPLIGLLIMLSVPGLTAGLLQAPIIGLLTEDFYRLYIEQAVEAGLVKMRGR